MLPREPRPSGLPVQSRSEPYDGIGCIHPALRAGLDRWAKRPIAEGNRHNTLTADARWLVKDCGLQRGDIEDLLRMRVAASPGRHPVTDTELEKMITWAQR